MVIFKLSRLFVLRIACLFLFVSLAGCKIFKPAKMPAALNVPAKFGSDSASSSIGFTPRKQFFSDTNLTKLLDSAIKNNFDVLRAMQRIQIARATLFYNKRRFLPTISLNATGAVENYGDYTMNGVGNYDSNLSPNLNSDQKIPDPTPDFFLGLRSSWEIGIWGKYKNSKRAANAQFMASEKGRHLVITSLVADVANLYYDLLSLDNELATIRKNMALQDSALSTIQLLKEGAQANELAVKQFRSQLLNTKGLEIKLQQQIIETENILNLYLGRLPQEIKRGSPITKQDLPVNLSGGIPSEMLTRRPDIQQAELRLEAAKFNVSVARASFLPSLNLLAYTGYNAFKLPLLFSTPASLVYGAIAGLSAPIMNRSLIKTGYNISVAEKLDAFYSYQQTIAIGFQEVTTHLNGIKNNQKLYSLKEQEVTNSQEAVDVSRILFRTGSASYLEVLTAQRVVLQSELELTYAKRDQFRSVIELYRSLGGGWE